MKMEHTECSEMSAYKIQTPGNYPEEKHTTYSLKSRRMGDVCCPAGQTSIALTLSEFSLQYQGYCHCCTAVYCCMTALVAKSLKDYI